MQIFASVLAAVLAAQAVVASPIRARSPYVVKETHFAPPEWTKLDRADGAKTVQLQIGLKQGNMDGLLKHLDEISDPDHALYGAHLSADEVDDLVRPSKETCDQVEEWLREAGVKEHSYSTAKDWIFVHLPIDFVERLLDTEYHNYKHEDGAIVSRTTHWSLPRHLHEHIDLIQPTTSFFRGSANAATYVKTIDEVHAEFTSMSAASAGYGDSDISKVCNVSSVSPQCFETLYKTKGYNARATDKNSIGFANYLEEIPIRPDTELFLKKYSPESVSAAKSFKTYSIDGGPLNDGPLTPEALEEGKSMEANLDVQAIAGISQNTPIVSYSTGGRPPFIPDLTVVENDSEPYLTWVNWLQQQKDIPKIISTSYGEPEQTVPRSYAKRVCEHFAAVGSRGTTLFFSSGDRGLGGTDKCYSNIPGEEQTPKFLPAFPAACPYVTAVGATQNFEPEQAVYRAGRNTSTGYKDLYASGSGFSSYFKRPTFQKDVVPNYVKSLGDLYTGLYNPEGRGYPDLAAQGLYFAYVWNGTESTISGTSASTPLTAGIFALVNDALIASGKPTLGFINPWLYKRGYKGLTDVTIGYSYGCNVQGFPVTKGWDPITGFGTPNFPELVKLAGGKLN